MNDLERPLQSGTMLLTVLHTTAEDALAHLADGRHHLNPPIDDDHPLDNANAPAPRRPFVTRLLARGNVPEVLPQDEDATCLQSKKG
jgi:hypothetical protein